MKCSSADHGHYDADPDPTSLFDDDPDPTFDYGVDLDPFCREFATTGPQNPPLF
jgi:hypothetical protein